METMTPRTALDDPRFPVLRGPDGEDLRKHLKNGDPDDRPWLPTGWRWTADQPPKLEIPRRWRVDVEQHARVLRRTAVSDRHLGLGDTRRDDRTVPLHRDRHLDRRRIDRGAHGGADATGVP